MRLALSPVGGNACFLSIHHTASQKIRRTQDYGQPILCLDGLLLCCLKISCGLGWAQWRLSSNSERIYLFLLAALCFPALHNPLLKPAPWNTSAVTLSWNKSIILLQASLYIGIKTSAGHGCLNQSQPRALVCTCSANGCRAVLPNMEDLQDTASEASPSHTKVPFLDLLD